MKQIYIVEKNRDFTEGRGPMIFHSAWENFSDADSYVMKQKGVMGSEQYRRVDGDLTDSNKGYWCYNGYHINRVDVFESNWDSLSVILD